MEHLGLKRMNDAFFENDQVRKFQVEINLQNSAEKFDIFSTGLYF